MMRGERHEQAPLAGTPGGTHRPPRRVLVLWLILVATAGPLVACYGPDYDSVHFRGDRPDFFRMPQPWRGVPEERRAMAPTRVYDQDQDLTKRKRQIALPLRCEAAGLFRQAAAAWSQIHWQRLDDDYWEGEDRDDPLQFQALDDRIAALRTWRGPQDTEALRLYLRARDLVNAGRGASARRLLSRLTREPFRTRADYLGASLQFRSDPLEGARAFRAFLKRHPSDPLALYMLGRCFFTAILDGASISSEESEPRFARPSGWRVRGSLRKRLKPRRLSADLRARYLREAMAAYEACIRTDPHGPLAEDARGKVAGCLFRQGQIVEALIRYCGQLAKLPPGRENHYAFLSARDCLKRMTYADHMTFQAETISRPQIAGVYLDLHLLYGRAGARAAKHLGEFALALLRRHRSAPVSGRLLARLAVMEDRLGRWQKGERLATAAMRRCAAGVYRDQARWQRALSLRHLGRRREALAEYERLAENGVPGNLRRGAHEAAAILSEEEGDRPNAIRHYFDLDYQADYAYLVDCVASMHELRSFLRRFPRHPRAKLVRYSIGFRELRSAQYHAAVQTFASLGLWLDTAEKAYDCRTSKDKPRWPPLRLARFLADSVRSETSAGTKAAKARIAYRRGQVLFQQRYVAFYNGALWTGSREVSLDLYGPNSTFSGPSIGMAPLSPAEQRVFDRYEAEHTPLFQAAHLFERIARDYPGTAEAPKALYSAALCYGFSNHMERYLARLGIDSTARQIHLYRQLQREYPHDPLAAAAAKYGGPLPSTDTRRNSIRTRGRA